MLSAGFVPSNWLRAIIVPVFQKSSAGIATNYRPISLTCVASKVIYSSLLHRKGSNYNKKRKITEKAWNEYTIAHTSKQQSNTQKSKQTIYRKDYQPWLRLSLLCELAQLISSISCKQRAQTIFWCYKFLQKYHCTSIDLWLNSRKIKIDLTFSDYLR